MILPVRRAATVNRTIDDAFAVFINEIGAWWPLPTHGLFGDRSGGVVFRDQKLIEQSLDGNQVIWAEVIAWEPPVRLVMAWHPGHDAADASEVEVNFEADGQGTRVTIEHRGWEVFGAEAMQRRHGYIGPNAWGGVLDHYADGAEDRPDPVDVDALARAYGEFFAAAEMGGFGPAPAGEWNAEQVVAHVALNDASMLSVCQGLIHQNAVRFENQICQDPDVLDRYVKQAGEMSTLIERGRRQATLVIGVLRRLSAEQLATEVPCHLTHDGQVMLDRPVPWKGVAVDTQTDVHLPAHIEQLANLR